MEILILIGIFAFVIAIIFRSNEALDRVDKVEKEVKILEEEIVPKAISAEAPLVEAVQSPVSETAPETPIAAEDYQKAEEPTPGLQNENGVPADTAPVSYPSDPSFPRTENIHMN